MADSRCELQASKVHSILNYQPKSKIQSFMVFMNFEPRVCVSMKIEKTKNLGLVTENSISQ